MEKFNKVNVLRNYVLAVVFGLLVMYPCIGAKAAVDPISSSQNYSATGQIDFSGTSSDSENYSMYGFLTDVNDVSFWPDGSKTAGPETIKPTIEPTKQPSEEPGGFYEWLKSLVNQPWFSDMLKWTSIFSGLLGLLSLLAPWLSNLPWLNLGSTLWSRFLWLLGWNKKKRQWGIVYDSESAQPIAMAAVQIYDYNEKKLLNTDISDADGRFGFMVGPGKYYLQAVKNNYYYPSKLVYRDYHREMLKVDDESTIINVNIPMDPDILKLGGRIGALSIFIEILDIIRIPVLVFGTIIAIANYIVNKDTINMLIILFYIILWIIEAYNLRKIKTYGIIASLDDNQPVALAIVRILNQKTQKIIATKVSSADGKYFHLISPGEYTIISTKEEFDQYKISDLRFKRGDVLTRDIYMKRKDNKV